MKNLMTVSICFLSLIFAKSQEVKPKLVIGIVVDQMRYDYLQKFKNDYGEGGFNRLMTEGEVYHKMHYNYKPTYTGPGHASVFTGTTPAHHGIIANNWYNRTSGKNLYCVEDESKENFLSPANLKAQTIADVLKLKFLGQSKTYGVALKDRGAILPVGRSANAAFWFDSRKGKWVSSTYYQMDSSLLEKFNQRDFKAEFMAEDWTLTHDLESYSESRADNSIAYEAPHYNGGRVSFPYDSKKLFEHRKFDALKATPFGNQMTIDLAQFLIEEESLGKDEYTDFLSVSFSATDYIGHQFGVLSKEVHDCYVKLDLQLSSFIDYLDDEVGRDQYILFLTSDHAAGENPNALKDKGISAGYIDRKQLKNLTDSLLDKSFGEEDWIESFQNLNFYLDHKLLNRKSLTVTDIYQAVHKELISRSSVADVWMSGKTSDSKYDEMIKEGFLENRSGDIILLEESNYVSYGRKGSTHGSPYNYDTHVPFLIFGGGIAAQQYSESYVITDIAAIICAKLLLSPPDKSQ